MVAKLSHKECQEQTASDEISINSRSSETEINAQKSTKNSKTTLITSMSEQGNENCARSLILRITAKPSTIKDKEPYLVMS